MAELTTCVFCDLKGARPCGQPDPTLTARHCTRERGHSGSHIHCHVTEARTQRWHNWTSFEQTQPELDRATFDRMQSALQQMLVEHDTDTWQYELAHGAIYPGEPIERNNVCPRCHDQSDASGPYACPHCGTGERRREAS